MLLEESGIRKALIEKFRLSEEQADTHIARCYKKKLFRRCGRKGILRLGGKLEQKVRKHVKA